MQLDRYTEKAQEAIAAAQQAAQTLESPVLDAEHLLHALVEPDDGVPAETPPHPVLPPLGGPVAGVPAEPLRRLGVDLPAFRDELAAILAKRAHIQGGSL